MTKPSLCLNMIVKNEADRIKRCLSSVLSQVKCVAILDTGSTDGTVKLIEQLCCDAGVPCAIGHCEFKNFSQARNEAFAFAQACRGQLPWTQFALLVDADMELVCDTQDPFAQLNANALSYDMMQKGGSVSYANRRIINLDWGTPPYVGVTHEYVDIQAAGMIVDARFTDYADGSNRKEKYIRDAQLLEEALKTEPNNERYWFYLGNTYKDWAQADPVYLSDAINAYRRRIELGGWNEEVHQAKLKLAECYKAQGDGSSFVAQMIDAYAFRPQRAEPLYELAKYHREKGDNAASVLFSKQGKAMSRPDDLLFVNDFAYEHGLRYEYAVAGYYVKAERKGAFQVTNDLSLDPTCPEEYRWSSRQNLFFYTKPLKDYCPSFKGTKLEFNPPEGYTAMNPSLEVCNGNIRVNMRCVNYKIDEHGRYMIGEKGCNDAPIDTRNFVCKMDEDFNILSKREVIWHRSTPQFPLVTGLEDIRLWRYCGQMHFSATIRESLASGVPQMVQGKLVEHLDYLLVKDWTAMSDGKQCEKNWMPMPSIPFGDPRFMYRLDVTTTPTAMKKQHKQPVKFDVGNISGSSQLIPWRHGYLAVVHEAIMGPADGKRTYWHRFAWWDQDARFQRLSLPFVFYDRQIEFCAGLAIHPNCKDIAISFGVRDEEAHIATVGMEEVAQFLWATA